MLDLKKLNEDLKLCKTQVNVKTCIGNIPNITVSDDGSFYYSDAEHYLIEVQYSPLGVNCCFRIFYNSISSNTVKYIVKQEFIYLLYVIDLFDLTNSNFDRTLDIDFLYKLKNPFSHDINILCINNLELHRTVLFFNNLSDADYKILFDEALKYIKSRL